jgi:hypothetical protein
MFCIYTNEERNPKRVLCNKNNQCIPSHPVEFVKRFSLFYSPAKWNNFHTYNPRPSVYMNKVQNYLLSML